jgi:hypothetical protein
MKERVMKKSKAIFSTVSLGAVLMIGSATASMARGFGDGVIPATFYDMDPLWWPSQFRAHDDHDDSAAAYCKRLYRSYDPASGTYLGRHGIRRHCA